jgi:hypothetical protein
MSATLECLSSPIRHGSPAGYRAGCRSEGGCPNHGSRELLTCSEAAIAYRGDFSLSKLPPDRAIPRAAIKLERTRPAATPPNTKAKRSTAEHRAKPVSSPRPTPPRPPKPAKPTPAPKPEIKHGTLEGYWQGGCYRDDLCPSDPTCAAVNLAHVNGQDPPAPKKKHAPNAPRQHKPHEPVHGTVYGFARGCKSETECPNVAAGGPSCTEVRRAYYRDYTARRRAGAGPAIKHGTAGGYQLGCHSRATCPGGPDGLTCADASLAAERGRRRRAGIPEQTARVDSSETIAHIAALREQGMSIPAIATASEVGRRGIRTLIYGRDDYTPTGPGPRHHQIPRHIPEDKATRILAVTAPSTRRQS